MRDPVSDIQASAEPHGPAVEGEGLDLERLDAAVETAIAAGDAGDLRVLGYGEITLVLGWPPERPAFAVKRLPLFRTAGRLRDYEALVDRYVATLRERGVRAVDTRVRAMSPSEAGIRAYLVQPLLPVQRLLTSVLREADEQRAAGLLDQLAEQVAATVDAHVGLDAQASNWIVDDQGRLLYIDISTPMLRSDGSRDELDTSLFLAAYPWALRPVLARAAHSVMSQYFDLRTVLIDVGSNLVKEGLEQRLPTFLRAASARLPQALDESDVRSYFARDKRFWMLMQRLRRMDRAWQRRVRRRPYPLLLPPPYEYGPPELPERKSR